MLGIKAISQTAVFTLSLLQPTYDSSELT